MALCIITKFTFLIVDSESKVKRLQQDNIEIEDSKRSLENQKDGIFSSFTYLFMYVYVSIQLLICLVACLPTCLSISVCSCRACVDSLRNVCWFMCVLRLEVHLNLLS